MRQLLRNYRLITRPLCQQRFRFASARPLETVIPTQQAAIDEQKLESLVEAIPNQQNTDQNLQEIDGEQMLAGDIEEQIDWVEYDQESDDEPEEDTEQDDIQMLEQNWQIAGEHLIRENFDIFAPVNRKQVAKQQIKKYEAALNINIMDHLNPKIYDEGHFKRRLAEYHLNTVSPLTPTLLKQGINFINPDSFNKMVKGNKISVTKKLLEGGAFEATDFIDPYQVNLIFETVRLDERNEYLLNLLCYEKSLLIGNGSMKEKLFYKTYQPQTEEILLKLNNSKSLNKLRMLWSFEKLYLYEHNLVADIIHELTKIKFAVDEKKQAAVNRESTFIVSSAFSQIPFQTFLSKLLKEVKTYQQFIKAYSLSIMLLSKLLAIPKMLSERASNQLHPIFELFEFNLSRGVNHLVLSKLILELLSHEDHSRVTYENYKRCYSYWLKDYTQPAHTKFHSPLSQLADKKESFSIIYEQSADVYGTAKTIYPVVLTKSTKPQFSVVKQGEVIRNLLAGRYDQVLDNFMVTLGMSTDPNAQQIFTDKLKKADRDLSFTSKQVEALYKLKLASNHFFQNSLPQPLNEDYLATEKVHEVTEHLLTTDYKIEFNQDIKNRNENYRMNTFFELDSEESELTEEEETAEKKEREKQVAGIENFENYPNETIFNFNYFVFGNEGESFYEYLCIEHPDLMKELDSTFVEQGEQDQNELQNDEDFSEDEEFDQTNELEFKQFKEENRPKINHQERSYSEKPTPPKSKFFSKKAAAEFSTYNKIERKTPFSKISSKFSTQIAQGEGESQVVKDNIFNYDRIEQYRTRPVEKDFLKLIQSEQHIPNIGSGTTIAKYLFLHSRENGKFVINPNKALNIEFTSAIGTRTKDYGKYLKNSLFNYELLDDFYEELLLDQLASYNRHEFKLIVAHLIHFKDNLSDPIIDAFCNICEKELIGYSFVEIAQFIKANGIRISAIGLERLTKTWHKFDIINEDMLSFVREYCRKMQMNMQTSYYGSFCKSLIKTEKFDKLELVCSAILVEIKPKPFRFDASMKAENIPTLEKEWKIKQQEQYVRLYFELIEVVVTNLGQKVPTYLSDMFDDFKKLRTTLNEKELGYAFVCYCLKRQKIEELLTILDRESEKGTSFMYDCLLQALLSNFNALEDLSQKMLDTTVLKNRITLQTNQIMKSLIVFKKSSSSNSFSKFLEHCLRFQPDIHKINEVKREMYYIMNNNVEDVSVGGVFNLLDFIFSEKREKERVEYRAIKLSEEEKFKKLQEIQQAKTKAAVVKTTSKEDDKKDKKKKKKSEEEQIKAESVVKKNEEKSEQNKEQKKQQAPPSGKDAKKKIKKEKVQERDRKNSLLEQMLAQDVARSLPQQTKGSSDEELVIMIKNQTKLHESSKRKSVQSLNQMFGGAIQMMKEEEAARIKESEKKDEKKEVAEQQKKGGKKGKGKAKK